MIQFMIYLLLIGNSTFKLFTCLSFTLIFHFFTFFTISINFVIISDFLLLACSRFCSAFTKLTDNFMILGDLKLTTALLFSLTAFPFPQLDALVKHFIFFTFLLFSMSFLAIRF